MRDVRHIVGERELLGGGVTGFTMFELVVELEVVAQCAGNGAQPADMLGMSPACIVPPQSACEM